VGFVAQSIIQLLIEYPNVIEEISVLHKQLIELLKTKFEEENPLKSIEIKDTPRGTGASDPTFEIVQKIIDGVVSEIRDISERMQVLYAKKNYVESFIKQLETTERRIIRLRYLEGKKFWQISQVIHYSKTETWRLHQEILERMERMEQIKP
jgi:DNA-directed RNA polymerase specialized sigma24 family protein